MRVVYYKKVSFRCAHAPIGKSFILWGTLGSLGGCPRIETVTRGRRWALRETDKSTRQNRCLIAGWLGIGKTHFRTTEWLARNHGRSPRPKIDVDHQPVTRDAMAQGYRWCHPGWRHPGSACPQCPQTHAQRGIDAKEQMQSRAWKWSPLMLLSPSNALWFFWWSLCHGTGDHFERNTQGSHFSQIFR